MIFKIIRMLFGYKPKKPSEGELKQREQTVFDLAVRRAKNASAVTMCIKCRGAADAIESGVLRNQWAIVSTYKCRVCGRRFSRFIELDEFLK